MELGLKGRNAVITGGSMGIGKAIASGFAAEGVNVAILARGQEALDATAAEISEAHGGEVLTLSADLTDAEAVNAAVNTAVEKLGTINILVNSHGHRMTRPDRQLEWDDADWIGDINIKTVGMLRIIRALDSHFATDGTGRIINISGYAGTEVFGGALTHGINNAAMLHASGYLANDLSGKNITVNTVVPGLVNTEWRQGWAKMMAEKQNTTPEEFVSGFVTAAGSMIDTWATMAQVADLVIFLASDRASYINGAKIPIDGGISLNPR